MTKPHGATADDWAHLALVLGPQDLLPVVSNPGAQISEMSTLKGKGKTPSLYNRDHKVVGIPGWAQKQSTDAEIARWAKEDDYGICIITRRARALDIDVANVGVADRIQLAFEALAAGGDHLPVRHREGTGKRLLAFVLVGSYPKRSFKLRADLGEGLVEFLGDGQQFVALGTHFKGDGTPSGTRYEWLGGLPYDLPVLDQAAFETAWDALAAEFGDGASVTSATSDRNRADIDGLADPVAQYLDEQGLVLSVQGEKVFVECPWKSGHTSDSGISETCWLVAGSRGFQQGHFQCMHASCQGREDVAFLDEIGFRASAFSDLGAEPSQVTPGSKVDVFVRRGMHGFKRDGNGAILPTIGNVEIGLSRPDLCGAVVRYDAFLDDLIINGPDEQWRVFTDADAVRLRVTLADLGFKPVGKELMRDALTLHARDNTFDSATDWLQGLEPWDGVERVAGSMHRYFAWEDTPYADAVGRYLFTALAGRVMEPGCKADMALILQGPQGLLKSSAVEALAPAPEMFRELSLHDLESDNLARALRGCLVGELAELKGLRGRESEAIRAWIVRKHERWVPKFVERQTSFPRRCVLIGTSNPKEVLDDDTGERRWLPGECMGALDIAGLIADRGQLWAEGLFRWGILGIEWQDAERLARAEHVKFKARDTWADVVAQWLDEPVDVSGETANGRGWVRLTDVFSGALNREASHVSRPDELRLGRVLRGLGWKSQGHRVDGKSIWCWVRHVVSDA